MAHAATKVEVEAQWTALAALSRRVALQTLHEADLADDVSQEVLFDACRKAASIRSLEAWVAFVTRHRCWKALAERASAGETRMPDDDEVMDHSWSLDRVTERVLAQEVLGLLRPFQAELLLLCASGDTHREIAQHIGCEIHQVGPRIARAQAAARRVRDHGSCGRREVGNE